MEISTGQHRYIQCMLLYNVQPAEISENKNVDDDKKITS